MNLENCRYVSLSKFTPPLTARKRTAVDKSPTAKNSRTVRTSSVEYSSVAVLLRAIKGQAESVAFDGWIYYLRLGI